MVAFFAFHSLTTGRIFGEHFKKAKLASWQSQPERFTDLNEPMGQGEQRVFPILDPRAASIDKVEGLAIDPAAMPGTNAERLPMPVEWLYVLRDGSMKTAESDGRVPGASAENPITARVAYWTDDESGKININTAAEGVPWDTPRCDTLVERNYARYQPVTNEVQRYPGHPATTCLSSLLYPGHYVDEENSPLTAGVLADIFRLTPRVKDGGTLVGTTKGTEPIVFDKDPLFTSPEAWAERVRPKYIAGLVTAHSSAPEVTVHGRPRMSIWPVSEVASKDLRSGYDNLAASRASHGPGNGPKYYFQRGDALSRHGEFYLRANRGNVNLYRYIMSQVYRPAPGVGGSLAMKYGATQSELNYAHSTEYKLDHVNIGLQIMDYIRGINAQDGTVPQPYASFDTVGTFGQLPGINLIGRNLASDDGSAQQASNWQQPSLEPKGMGRIHTLSEVALVIYSTATVKVTSWPEGGSPKFGPIGGGSAGDAEITKRIIQNQHPEYVNWIGRKFGPEDVGKTFHFVEVGLLPELFCPAQGFHTIHPRISLRLLTGGSNYRGGLGGKPGTAGLRLNGIPLELWGDSVDSVDASQTGPLLMTADPTRSDIRENLPVGYFGAGGTGGSRIARFGDSVMKTSTSGFRNVSFMANGTGPLSALYCQTPVIVADSESITLTQDAPVQLLVYDTIPNLNGIGANSGNITQMFNLRWAMPEEKVTFARPNASSSDFAGWTRRFDRAAASNAIKSAVPILEPKDTECVKSVLVSHGDYRHVAGRRNVPSELLGAHPKYRQQLRAHSLTYDHVPGGTSAKASPGVTFADDLYGRSLVAGVQYDLNNRPDFTGNPANRAAFAPLLGTNYGFPIDPSITRDFDNGTGPIPDGAYINKPDDGADDVPGGDPYFNTVWDKDLSYDDRNLENWFPHRMVSSPVCFGSLPSAMQANAPWTCLLFRPNVSTQPHLGEAGYGMRYEGDKLSVDGFEMPQMASYRGANFPADHLWLDLFWMPAAAPEHTTSLFSTAGKINLNYQMFPFDHIKRATGLHAVMKSERLLCIPTSAGPTYKTRQDNPNWRKRIDAAETLKAFEAKFAKGELFLSESEICEHFLIPEGQKWDAESKSIRAFWDEHRLSGDNVLEKPYSNIYARLTTKSNAYAIHYRVQPIRKAATSAPDRFVPGQDSLSADLRGRIILERKLDVTKQAVPNYIQDLRHEKPRIEAFYAYQVIARRRW